MKKVIITGFVPFHIFSQNPAQAVAEHLGKRSDIDVVPIVLPVEYGRAREILLTALKKRSPDLVISFGLNGKISHIALEEIAVNIRGSDIPDNTGIVRMGDPISEDGPVAYRSRLPIARIKKRLLSEGIPVKVSYSAGVYLCNEIFYTVMQWCQESGAKGGFVHVPMATEYLTDDPKMTRMPNMYLVDLKRAADMILDISVGIR
ncbi:MAG: pyroglutamyl-peptidase I [Thermoplasmata archaeon]|nr:pyroglutamyl-peptidase I [Thermoplasmata archaeon]